MTIARMAGLADRPVIKPAKELVVSDRNCGVEIEIENINRAALSRKLSGIWDVTDDHSLRPHGASAELRSLPGGVCGKVLVDSLKAYDKLGVKAGDYHFSWRTGIHVHVDVRDRTPDDIRVLATKYALIEPYLFNWAGYGRHESRFSMPWWVCAQDVSVINRITSPLSDDRYRNESQSFQSAVGPFSKYTSLNLAPLTRLGTVEFRHAQSTHDIGLILEYINICLALVESSVANDDPQQCAKLVEEFTANGPRSFMHKHIHPLVNDLIYASISGTRPMTRDIIQSSIETAMQIAELGDAKMPAKICAENIDIVEAVVAGRNTARMRARVAKFNSKFQ